MAVRLFGWRRGLTAFHSGSRLEACATFRSTGRVDEYFGRALGTTRSTSEAYNEPV